MSQLGTGELDDRMRRTRANVGPVQTGVTERLLAPGIVPIGPESADANLAAQFDQAIGVTGRFANQVQGVLRSNRIESERVQRQQEVIDRGLAVSDASTDIAQDEAEIANYELDFYEDLDKNELDVETYADKVIDARTQGMSEAYKERYSRSFKPALVQRLVGRREAIVEDAKNQSIAKMYNAASGAESADEIRDVLEAVRELDPSLTDAQLKAPLIDIAESFADSGYEEGVVMIFDVLGDDLQLSRRDVNNRLANVLLAHQTRVERDRSEWIESLIRSGEPAELVRDRIENLRDRFRTDATPERLLGMLASREAGKVADLQKEHLNETRLRVGLGIYPEGRPDLAAAQIIGDMSADPSSPNFIPAQQGLAIIDNLGNSLKTNAYRTGVESKLSGDGSLPLTASYDTAIDQAFADRGIVEAIPTENGQALIRKINDPQRFAFESDKAGRVTSSARELIASGLAGDQQQAFQSAEAYVALYQQNPDLAEQVVQNMGEKAKLRARFLTARLPYNDSPWNERGFMQITPVDIDKDTLRQAVWAPDSDGPLYDSKIRSEAREFIDEAIQESEFRNGFVDSRGGAVVSNTMAKRYADILEEEFLFARSMVDDDTLAMTNAKKQAGTRFLVEHPPVLWDGETYLTDSAAEVTPDFQQYVETDLKREGWTEDAIEDLVSDFRPTWDRENRAWAFVDDNGLFKEMSGTFGEKLLIRPYDPADIESLNEKKQEWERKAREERRRRIEQRDDTFEGLDPTTIDSIP